MFFCVNGVLGTSFASPKSALFSEITAVWRDSTSYTLSFSFSFSESELLCIGNSSLMEFVLFLEHLIVAVEQKPVSGLSLLLVSTAKQSNSFLFLFRLPPLIIRSYFHGRSVWLSAIS